MKPFEISKPRDLAEARHALTQHGSAATPMAGGQTLLLQMKPRLTNPGLVVHVGRLENLRGWAYNDGSLELGAATPYAMLEDASRLAGAHELLRSVAGNLSDRAVRNLGTIGGSISAGMSAYDVPVALLTLDARLELRTSTGARTLTVDEFIQGEAVTARQPDELLEKVTLPARENWTWGFQKFRRRLADAATASVAVLARVGDDGTVNDSRFVVGAVTDKPFRLPAVETALRGLVLGVDPTADVAALAGDETKPLVRPSLQCSAAYAHQLIRTLTARALQAAAQN